MPKIWRNVEKNKALINQAAKSHAFIIFDTETTGLKKDDEIIELACCKCCFKNGKFYVYDNLHMYLKPNKAIAEEAIAVHGITNEYLADKPKAEDVFHIIKDFFGEAPIVGAYNSNFDVKMLTRLYERCGESLNIKLEVDLLKIARDIFCEVKMPNHKLITVANAYGVDENISFHNAMDDVTVTIRVLNCMIDDLIKNTVDKELIKACVYKCNFFKGFRGNSRLYVVTSRGVLYYALKDDKWTPNDPEMNLAKLDMTYIEKQVFAMSNSHDYKELRKRCFEGFFDQEKKEGTA